MKGFYFMFFIIFIFMVFYYYFNLFLVVLSLEFVMLFIYLLLFDSTVENLVSYSFMILLSCFFVLEAILSLNLLLLSYRFYGSSFFFVW